MTHIMLDLETLGTGPRAAIVAIGACEFDPHGTGIGITFYRRVSLASAMAHGDVDPDTLLWWMKQSDDARASTFGGESSRLDAALTEFNGFAPRYTEGLWGNGATFDNVVIRSGFKAVGLDPAWSFRADKCYRTVINLLPEDKRPPFVRAGTAHNALDDAITQALYLQRVYKALGL